MIALGQRDQIGLTAITTVVVLVVAADKDHNAWQEPFLRLLDTLIGVTIGLACRWILSSMYSVSQQSGFDGR
jgi:multisubunit Na+/H+ antiporter MnhB subunit